MRINLVTRDNGVGLTQDIALLLALLRPLGHDVEFASWDLGWMRPCDVALHIELLNPRLFPMACYNIFLPHWEWFHHSQEKALKLVDEVWAKSRDAVEIAERMGTYRITFTGALSRDIYDSKVERTDDCFHLRGRSKLKGTEAILQAWTNNPNLPYLHIVSSEPLRGVPANVGVSQRLPDADLFRLANACPIHLCPSEAEGWGHHLMEGLSTGAHVITTDAPPMNEHVRPEYGTLLQPITERLGYARRHIVQPHLITEAVIAAMDGELRPTLARAAFLASNLLAAKRIASRLAELASVNA